MFQVSLCLLLNLRLHAAAPIVHFDGCSPACTVILWKKELQLSIKCLLMKGKALIGSDFWVLCIVKGEGRRPTSSKWILVNFKSEKWREYNIQMIIFISSREKVYYTLYVLRFSNLRRMYWLLNQCLKITTFCNYKTKQRAVWRSFSWSHFQVTNEKRTPNYYSKSLDNTKQFTTQITHWHSLAIFLGIHDIPTFNSEPTLFINQSIHFSLAASLNSRVTGDITTLQL